MLAVTGVTGHTGSAIAEALLEAKKPVRVVVRDAKKGEPWRVKGAEVAVAPFEDSSALARALQGAEGAYLLLPPYAFNETGLAASRKALIESILAAVREARPKHVVFLSSIGAQHPSGTGPIAYLHPVEKGLAAEGTPSTFLRAAYFMENWGGSLKMALDTGSLYNGLSKEKKIPMIATRDIGRAAARLLLDPIPSGTRVVELSGPEEYSFEDAAAILSRLTGKSIQAVQLPIDSMVGAMTGMGMSREVAELYGELTQGVNAGLVAWEGGRAQAQRGDIPLEGVMKKLLEG